MTNLEYRRSRGTDHEFTATPDEVRQAWYELNQEKIDVRRVRDKKYKGHRNGICYRKELDAE